MHVGFDMWPDLTFGNVLVLWQHMTQGWCNQCGMAGPECGLSDTVEKTRQLAKFLGRLARLLGRLGRMLGSGLRGLGSVRARQRNGAPGEQGTWARAQGSYQAVIGRDRVMADPNALRHRILEMETRIHRVEGFMGTPPEPLETTVFQALEKIDSLQKSVNEIPSFIEGRIVSMGEDLSLLTDVMDLKIDAINTELSVMKRAVGSSMPDERPSSSKRQGVKDLPSVYAAAERLVDFYVDGGPDSEKKKSKDGGKDKGKNSKYGKDEKSKFKKAKDAASDWKPKESQPEIDRSRKGYFICGGDHRMRDCPKRSKLNALMAEDDESGKDVAPSQTHVSAPDDAVELTAEKDLPCQLVEKAFISQQIFFFCSIASRIAFCAHIFEFEIRK
ncbi:hypothetical protein BUALT_Bualt06G0066700 [Buddleja alternifolia]|uniref:Uncharacterized protein n=1 Tax=Buddleja alternifolia TaxID=168488 RepID=A0AAV6XEL0_9LAMI|nr:hypothetical protein BUALT_Bualt06G0066700 [Buddleja alternifolia]